MFLGAKGGNAWLFFKHSKVNLGPYDPDAPLLFGAGALAGTGLIGTSRMEAMAVSPVKTEIHSYGNVGVGARYQRARRRVYWSSTRRRAWAAGSAPWLVQSGG